MSEKFGLIGTITFDWISHEEGSSWKGLGGVLYQGAVLCALEKEVFLYSNLGSLLVSEVQRITKDWPMFRRRGVIQVTGPGNQVYLHYPQSGEREEILRSVVPPVSPYQIIEDLPELAMLILVINSGFDIELNVWRKIIELASSPLWVDIHSLPLSKEIGVPRKYLPLPEWAEWTEGVQFIQANAREMASMLGHPEREPTEEEMDRVARTAFDTGTEAIFVTLGNEGVLVMTPKESKRLSSVKVDRVVDTTGCGDVFCAATAVGLSGGEDPFRAATFGLELASKAVTARGVEETYGRIKSS